MARLYRTSIWQVELPDGWQVRPFRRHGAVLYRPDGLGQLQVTTRPNDEMRKQMRFDAAIHQTFSGRLSGITCQSESGNTFSQTWCLSSGDREIYVKYYSAIHNRSVELDEVGRVVASIEAVA